MTKKISVKQQQKDAEFLSRAKKYFAKQDSIPIAKLSSKPLPALLALLGLAKYWSADDMSYIFPLEDVVESLFPTQSGTVNLMQMLSSKKMIGVSLEHAMPQCFKEESVEGGGVKFSWMLHNTPLFASITWKDNECIYLSYIPEVIEDVLSEPNPELRSQLRDVMNELAVAECSQYYDLMLQEYGFDFEVNEKTLAMFRSLLEDHPVSEIFPCIWSAVRSAAAFLQTSACQGRPHAYNTIYGKIQAEAAKRRSGQLKSLAFARNHRLPRSIFSIVLYKMLGFDGDVGFTKKISDIQLPERWTDTSRATEDNFSATSFTPEESEFFLDVYGTTFSADADGVEITIGEKTVLIKKIGLSFQMLIPTPSVDGQKPECDMILRDMSSLKLALSALHALWRA